MITDEEIKSLGFEYVEDWSTDEVSAYKYLYARPEKGINVNNFYRIDRVNDTDYFNIYTNLERLGDFTLNTRGYNGDIEDITELFNIFDYFKSQNLKI